MKICMLENEYWYGGCVHDGLKLPVGTQDCAVFDLSINRTPNQAQPFFVSSKGRYILGGEGFLISFQNGAIETSEPAKLYEGFETLKGAYLAASSAHFPFSGTPDEDLFAAPVYNTWIELTFNQNQEDVLRYASGILEHGMPPGVLMIDDGWSDYYGGWRFHAGRFPDPRGMIERLHEMGFKVMLWVCPFVTPDTLHYRDSRDRGLLVRSTGTEPYIVKWWNGYSAVLDFSNPAAEAWLGKQLDELLEMGVDGFKFDAGDSIYYRADNLTAGGVSPNEQSLLWARFGERYPCNEFRVTFNAGGLRLMQRLCDKAHAWDGSGLLALIPDSLAAGITGHPFCCPDMIGGGEYLNFAENSGRLDAELFNRHSEIACLLPAMQFSAAPWRVLPAENFDSILKSIELRKEYQAELLGVIRRAGITGEPVARYMEYEFPGQGMERVVDQFMLGEAILVAPIYKKGESSREVIVPAGKWSFNGSTVEGGRRVRLTPKAGQPVVLKRQC